MAKAPAKKAEKNEGFDPFKVKKTSKSKSELASFQLKGPQAKAVDEYAKIHKEIKLLEGKQESFKNTVVSEAKAQFAKRHIDGQSGNLKILGESDSVTFIAQNAGSMLTAEDLEVISEKFGEKTMAALTETDYGSLKFQGDFIKSESNQKKLFEVLSKGFKKEELEQMFLPIASKVVDNVIDEAVKHVKTADSLADLYTALKIKAYIKV